MKDILPELVMNALRERYITGVSDAENKFYMGADEEDSLTGALGNAISMSIPRIFNTEKGIYSVSIDYHKLGGRGFNAAERRYGSDGIFQIQVSDSTGNVIRRKGLPFQSKKNWKSKNKKLLDQAKKMEQVTPGGIIIDYNPSGYSACTAADAIAAEGSKTSVEKAGNMHRLAQLLGDDFLNCDVGTQGLFYDRNKKEYAFLHEGSQIITTYISVTDK